MHPSCLRNIFVSVNMEFLCIINNKPRNAMPVMLDCSQYGTSRFKKYRRCHSLRVQRVIAESVWVKPPYLIQRRHIACSLASVRVTSSVCQPVQGSRLDVIVPWHAYCDISSITTYRVAAALAVECRTLDRENNRHESLNTTTSSQLFRMVDLCDV